MRLHRDSITKEPSQKVVRLDSAHSPAGRHAELPVLMSRRVRQVLTGSSGPRSQRSAGSNPTRTAALHVCGLVDVPGSGPTRTRRGVVQRFRNSFHTLSHIAGDPLVWSAEEGAILADLRETLSLTESALEQFETNLTSTACPSTERILALADAVDQRVDRLFDRMERLTGLRQQVVRLSAMLAGAPMGVAPRMKDVEALACEIVDAAQRDDALTLVESESPEQPMRVAAHAVSVAGLVARMAATDPAWRQERLLAVVAALLDDFGMMRVPSTVFYSTQPLTHPQRVLIQQHPAASAALVEEMGAVDERLVAAVHQHHERLDGSGYPDRTCGEAISPVARLLAVADVYVAMQSRRPHRPALSADRALGEVERAAAEGRLDRAWTQRLPVQAPHWLKIPIEPQPPTGAKALSLLAA